MHRIPAVGRLLAVLPFAALLAGCASAPLPPPPSDAFAISGPTLGARELRPEVCYSGEHFVFLGAQVIDSKSKTEARLVIDPISGPVVRFFESEHGDERSIVLRRKDCKVFETGLGRTGSMTNGVNEVALNLRLDCRTRHGDVVRGATAQKACL
jgi:hypothetical protein